MRRRTTVFRCENCGSGYSVRAASSLDCCPRCLARDRVTVPLAFELGWRERERAEPGAETLKRLPLDRGAVEDGVTAERPV
jgi:hypothetical protein